MGFFSFEEHTTGRLLRRQDSIFNWLSSLPQKSIVFPPFPTDIYKTSGKTHYTGYNSTGIFAIFSLFWRMRAAAMALRYGVGNFNKAKFKALTHYICARCEDDPSRLGATKLNKIIWYAETGHFLRTGKPLTGARYVKRQHGPVPACITFMVDELVQEGKIFVRDVPYYGQEKKEYINLKEPEIDRFFSASNIRDVDRLIYLVCDTHTARSISKTSHNEPWRLASIGEDLPLFTAIALPGELTENDTEWADKQIARLSTKAASNAPNRHSR